MSKRGKCAIYCHEIVTRIDDARNAPRSPAAHASPDRLRPCDGFGHRSGKSGVNCRIHPSGQADQLACDAFRSRRTPGTARPRDLVHVVSGRRGPRNSVGTLLSSRARVAGQRGLVPVALAQCCLACLDQGRDLRVCARGGRCGRWLRPGPGAARPQAGSTWGRRSDPVPGPAISSSG